MAVLQVPFSLHEMKKSSFYGFLFVAVFIAQQVIALVWGPFKLVSPYWIAVTLVAFFIGFKLPIKKYLSTDAFRFAAICAICSILTILNGSTIGEVVVRIIYVAIAFFGFVMLNERRLDLIWIDFLLVILYVFYYNIYFSKDIGTRLMCDGDLFGHSSSNTIAITLNIILWLYYLLARFFQEKKNIRLIFFSVLNLVLIVIQGSRAGIIVALLLLLLIIVDAVDLKNRWSKLLLFSLVFGGTAFLVFRFMPVLEEVVDVANMQGFGSYEENIRSEALSSFFRKMDFLHCLVGYNNNHEFVSGITRTFNAFVDFWKTFGLLPMIFLLVGIIRRVKNRSTYMLSLLSITPILFYSFVESLWGGTLWDIIIFICIFWRKKSVEESMTSRC